MRTYNRREAIQCTAAAATGTLALFSRGAAAQPRASRQGGLFRLALEGVTVTSVNDGVGPQDPALALTEPAHLEEVLGRVSMKPADLKHARNVFLVEAGPRKALVDSGFGLPRGQAIEQLRSSGLDFASVTDILVTHCHGDHLSGLVAEGKAVFPKALVRISREDFEYFSKQAAPRAAKPLQDVIAAYGSRVKTFAAGEAVFPGTVASLHPGHTPGHSYFTLKAGADTVVFAGDYLHMLALQMQEPSISVKYDMAPKQAADERIALMKASAADRSLLVAGCHVVFPGIGRYRTAGAGFAYESL